MKEAKANARMKLKTKKFYGNKNIYPNFYFIPISRVFWVDQMIGDQDLERIKGRQDLEALPVEMLRHLKRILGS